jgi:uncharacterized membrane protein
MWDYLKIYGVALIIFFAIDMLWLGVIAKNLYDRFIGDLLGDVKWVPAIIFYLLFIVGLTFFVIEPALAKESLTYALFAGMFFGFITYATYDLTNLATLQGWSLEITIIDLIWGSVLGGSVSLFTYLILG